MNFAETTKEQKQMLVLLVGGVITLVLVVGNLVIRPAKERAAAALETIAELEADVRKGESLLKRDVLVRREVEALSEELLNIHRTHLPPENSRFIWAVEKLSLLAEEQGLVISVQEHPNARYVRVRDGRDDVDVNSIPFWIPYSVDVEMNTSFANLKNYLAALGKNLPYASVAGLRIQPSKTSPEQHDVSLLVEWPVFRFGEDLAWVKEMQNGDTSP